MQQEPLRFFFILQFGCKVTNNILIMPIFQKIPCYFRENPISLYAFPLLHQEISTIFAPPKVNKEYKPLNFGDYETNDIPPEAIKMRREISSLK